MRTIGDVGSGVGDRSVASMSGAVASTRAAAPGCISVFKRSCPTPAAPTLPVVAMARRVPSHVHAAARARAVRFVVCVGSVRCARASRRWSAVCAWAGVRGCAWVCVWARLFSPYVRAFASWPSGGAVHRRETRAATGAWPGPGERRAGADGVALRPRVTGTSAVDLGLVNNVLFARLLRGRFEAVTPSFASIPSPSSAFLPAVPSLPRCPLRRHQCRNASVGGANI